MKKQRIAINQWFKILIMTNEERHKIIKTSWELHSKVETSYLKNPAKPEDEEWLEKQRRTKVLGTNTVCRRPPSQCEGFRFLGHATASSDENVEHPKSGGSRATVLLCCDHFVTKHVTAAQKAEVLPVVGGPGDCHRSSNRW